MADPADRRLLIHRVTGGPLEDGMGHVWVNGGTVTDGTLESLDVELIGLGPRTIDRDTAIAWLRDGHSLVPRSGPALQLVAVPSGDDTAWYIRADNAPEARDALPPSISG